MNFLLTIILSTLLATSALSAEPQQPKLTEGQKHLLNLAHDIAKKDGHQFPSLLQGIILQETNAGEKRSSKKPTRYYGVGQIKVGAARDVLTRFPQLRIEFGPDLKTYEQIKTRLIEDDVFNLSIASKYLLLMKSYGFTSTKQMALAYNQGPNGAKRFNEHTHYYPDKVMKAIQRIYK